MITTLFNIIEEDANSKFMFYNPEYAYSMPMEIQKRTICLNNPGIIKVLSDKLLSRYILRDIVKIPDSILIPGSIFNYDDIKRMFSHNVDKLVVQKGISSGGFGTKIWDSKTKHDAIEPMQYYLVSPYIESKYDINLTLIIFNNDTVLFPLSMQLLEKCNDGIIYRGSIFGSLIPNYINEKIYNVARLIERKLRINGYRGIIGIDFIIDENDNVLFIEFNCRFQGSSSLINIALKNKGLPSLQELNIQAFSNVDINYDFRDMKINYATVNYFQNSKKINLPQTQFISRDLDGLRCNMQMEKNCYLYRDLFLNLIVDV